MEDRVIPSPNPIDIVVLQIAALLNVSPPNIFFPKVKAFCKLTPYAHQLLGYLKDRPEHTIDDSNPIMIAVVSCMVDVAKYPGPPLSSTPEGVQQQQQ